MFALKNVIKSENIIDILFNENLLKGNKTKQRKRRSDEEYDSGLNFHEENGQIVMQCTQLKRWIGVCIGARKNQIIK